MLVFVECIRGHRQDRHRFPAGNSTNGQRGFQTIHFRHLHIHQDGGVVIQCRQLHGLGTVFSEIRDQACFPQQNQCNFLVDRIILGEQYALARMFTQQNDFRAFINCQVACGNRLVPFCQPDVEPESAALALGGLNPDFAPHQLCDASGDRQTESGAAIFPGGRVVGLLEGLEQARALILVHANAGVADFEVQQVAGIGFL